MAAYATTVVVNNRNMTPIGGGLGILTGTVDITNYNSTLAAIIAISGMFRSINAVILDSVSDNGYLGRWVSASNAIKCFYPTTAHTHVIPVTTGTTGDAVTNNAGVLESAGGEDLAASAATAAAAGEVANDVDVGVFNFVAIGVV